ncbi:pyrimidine dimer DNA glycosylase/endonuclease V [Acidiplasma sp.]|uniref:pyrimidine dimer DNA glycosylase/endonuclease V n=1 Tax=Acidiplasma sp. TaxID=1872114 RepID=UPI00258C3806|nr:pyrimidine dimer DNA glycosylase/endonuclease V [Acidiplasma sp.]
MRMWMVNPKYMCSSHLLGEHNEIHMAVGYLREGNHLGRYASEKLIQVNTMLSRHNQLVEEMLSRGYKHNSPLIFDPTEIAGHLFEWELSVVIDPKYSLNILMGRCSGCRERYLQNIGRMDLREKWEYAIHEQPNINNSSEKPKRYQVENAMQLLDDIL